MSLQVNDENSHPIVIFIIVVCLFFLFVFFSNSAISACTYEGHVNAAFSQGRERSVSV